MDIPEFIKGSDLLHIKIFIPGTDVIMDSHRRLYRKWLRGETVVWIKLKPTLVGCDGFRELYKIPLTGKRAAYSRYFLLARYNVGAAGDLEWVLVADFIVSNSMRCFFLDANLFVVDLKDGMYDLGSSYVWTERMWGPSGPGYLPGYTQVSSGLPDIKVAEDDLLVDHEEHNESAAYLSYRYQGKEYSQYWSGCGTFVRDIGLSCKFPDYLEVEQKRAEDVEAIFDFLELYQAKASDKLGSVLHMSPRSEAELLSFLKTKFGKAPQKLYPECTFYWLLMSIQEEP